MRRFCLLSALLPSLHLAPAFAEAPSVVTDIAPVHSLVAQVMGDLGAPQNIVDPSVSPHDASLKPSHARMLQEADLVVIVGGELTPWLPGNARDLSADSVILSLLEHSSNLLGPGVGGHEGHDHEEHADHKDDDHKDHEGHDEHGHDDHKEHADHDDHAHDDHKEHADHEGHDDHADHDDHAHDDHKEHEGHDDHAAHKDEAHEGHEDHDEDGHEGHAHNIDPHAWLSPENAIGWLDEIAEALSQLDPENAETYAANAAAATANLQALDSKMNSLIDPVRTKEFMVYHDAYAYFTWHYGLSTAATLVGNEGATPSAADVQAARDALENDGVRCFFTEPQFSPAIVSAVTEGYDVNVETIDPLGVSLDQGPDLYGQLIEKLATSFNRCLS